MELTSSNIKKFLIFSQKKAFLIFLEMKPCKVFQFMEIIPSVFGIRLILRPRHAHPIIVGLIFSCKMVHPGCFRTAKMLLITRVNRVALLT